MNERERDIRFVQENFHRLPWRWQVYFVARIYYALNRRQVDLAAALLVLALVLALWLL